MKTNAERQKQFRQRQKQRIAELEAEVCSLRALLEKSQSPSVSSKKSTKKEKGRESPEGKAQGVGVIRAHEAINFLSQIPKKDPLRKRALQIVTDWIEANQ